MLETLYIILAGAIVFVVGLPIVIAFDKWKKEMYLDEKQTDENERT